MTTIYIQNYIQNISIMEIEIMTNNSYPTWEHFIKTKQAPYFSNRKDFPMLMAETPTFMGVPVAKTPNDLKGADAVIIGAPYVATSSEEYMGVSKYEWIQAPKRVRQQSIRYKSGYIQDFDIDIFEKLYVVDYGDADIPPEVMENHHLKIFLKHKLQLKKKLWTF